MVYLPVCSVIVLVYFSDNSAQCVIVCVLHNELMCVCVCVCVSSVGLGEGEVDSWILIGEPSRKHPGIHCKK